MIRKLLILLLFFTSLSGCKEKIVNDPSPASIESGYYNGEIFINNERSTGIKVLEPTKDSNPDQYDLNIYAPFEGDVHISSRRCGIEKNVHYKPSSFVKLKFSDFMGSFKQNCFITIVVTPFFPDWDDSEFSIHSYMSGIYVRVKPDDYKYELLTNFGKSLQLRNRKEGDVAGILEGPLMVVNSTPGTKFAAFHCKDPGLLEKDVGTDGLVMLDVDDLHKEGVGCLIQLKDKAGGFTPFVLTTYASNFIPLPEPEFIIDGKKLHIVGSKFVSFTDIDGEPFFSNTAKVDYKKDKSYIIRQYTVKGRNIVCEYKNGLKHCLR